MSRRSRAFRSGASQRGATMVETGVMVAFAAMVIAGAVALGSEWISSTRDLSQGATLEVQRDSLRHAARGWYASRYCALQRREGDVGRPPAKIVLAVHDLRPYLPDGGLVREGRHEASRWRVVVERQQMSPPQLNLLWTLREGEPSEGLARRTGAVCDSDGDNATPEACSDFSRGGERLLWTSLLAQPTKQVSRTRRLFEWQQFNAIDCDTDGLDSDGDGRLDGDGLLDARCDVDGDGAFGRPYDHDGDGVDDTSRFDADGDGALDLDVAGGPDGSGDFAVDVRDWHALGC